MTPKHPPRVATWMLKHFGSGPNNDAVLGDLAEQYRQKDSAMWYWRQAMKAIPVSFFKEIRGHKRIAARALLTGWGMWILYVTSIFPHITPFFFGGSFGVYIEPRDPIGTAWTLLSAPVGVQASLARPFSFVFAVALPLIVWAMCGWLVARFHRAQQTGVVLLFAGSVLLMDLLLSGRFILHVRPPAAWLYVFVGHLAANVAASVLGILLGGGLLRDNSRTVSN
jgi:hypothetical protein